MNPYLLSALVLSIILSVSVEADDAAHNSQQYDSILVSDLTYSKK